MTNPETEKTHPLPEEEQSILVEKIIQWGNDVIAGKMNGNSDFYTNIGIRKPSSTEHGDFDDMDGPVLDLNDTRLSDTNKKILLSWIEKQLGTPIDQAPILAKYAFDGGGTEFKIFAKDFGNPDQPPFRFSRWQNDGEEPSYILWSQEMYEDQEECGFSKVS